MAQGYPIHIVPRKIINCPLHSTKQGKKLKHLYFEGYNLKSGELGSKQIDGSFMQDENDNIQSMGRDLCISNLDPLIAGKIR